MKNWRSYRSKTSQENKSSSIANDEVALLAARLEFFIPKLMDVMRPWQWLLYIFFWSLFVTVIDRHDLATWSEFMIKFMSRFVQNTVSIIPSLYLIDYLRPVFTRMSIVKASIYVLMILMIASGITMTLVMLIMLNVGWIEYNLQTFIIEVLFDTIIGGGFTLVFLLYFLRRYREVNALKQSFEYKLIDSAKRCD